MSLAAANPGGWSLNEVLTSVQMTFLQNELLKAIDGVGGGTYTLGAPLEFAGSAVRIAANLEVLSTGAISVQSGGELNMSNGATGTIDGDLTFAVNSDTLLQSGANLTGAAGSLVSLDALVLPGTTNLTGDLNVFGGGFIDVGAGGALSVTSADLSINGGAQILLQGGGALIIGAAGFIQANGGDITLGSGSQIIAQAGASIQTEDSEDIVINDAPEGFRLTLTPAFHDVAGQWEKTSNSDPLLGWVQTDVTIARSIWFALAVNPGDTVVNVYVRLEAEDHPGGLPAFNEMPRVELVSTDLDGVVTVHATKTDPSATEPDFDALHYILLGAGSTDTGTMPHLATADPLYIRVRGETGVNAVVGLSLRSVSGNLIARSYRAANSIR